MLRGINTYNRYSNYQSTLGQVRLQQALSSNPSIQKTVAPVETIDPVRDELRSSSLEYVKQYSTTMADVLQEANSLRAANSAGVMSEFDVRSSDTAVADVSPRYAIRREREVSVVVEQLAAAQQNVSKEARGSDLAEQNLAFTVSGAKGEVQVNVEAVGEDGAQKTNGQMFSEAAAIINKEDHGVAATVIEKDGAAALKFESTKTGTGSSFTVSGQAGIAEGIEDIAHEAADAQYRVTADDVTRSYTSQSNQVQLDAGRIEANLKETGETVIATEVDPEKVSAAVSQLLDSYNQAVSFLSGNVSHGRGTSVQLERLESPLAADSTLERLGISQDKEGNLILEKEKLVQSLKEETGLTKDLLSGSHGLAQTMFDRSTSAMNTDSASLIINDLKELDAAVITDPLQYMNMYSRNGGYQMNNYMALGLMMNYLA